MMMVMMMMMNMMRSIFHTTIVKSTRFKTTKLTINDIIMKMTMGYPDC